MKTLIVKDKLELIRRKVQDTMAYSMGFNFDEIIDATDLTDNEKKIAKTCLDWKVYAF